MLTLVPTATAHGIDQRTRSSGGLRKTRPRAAAGCSGIEAQAREAVEHEADRRVRLEPREVHPDADVRALREGEVEPGVLAAHVEAVGVGEDGRVAVRRGERERDELALADLRAAELACRASRSGRSPPRRARAAATPRPRSPGGRGRPRRGRAARGFESRCRSALAIMPSVVSMPPNMQHRGVRDRLLACVRPPLGRAVGGRSMLALSAAKASRPARSPDRSSPAVTRGDRGDDRVVPAEHLGRVGVLEPERVQDDRGRERPGELAAQLRRAGRLDRVEQPPDLVGDDVREPLADGVEAERSARTGRDGGRARRRPCVSMLRPTTRPVEKRGSSTVNVSASRIAASARSRRVTSQASERGHPRDGLSRAQPCEQRVRVVLQLLERHRRADRESRLAHAATIDALSSESHRGAASVSGSMIEARGLTKDYGDKRAVDGLTFTVRPGVVTGFLGPNGSGKSTTMRLILGLDAPTAGDVTVNGKHYRDHRGAAARGRRAARGALGAHRPLRLQPPARAGADARDSEEPRRRADRPGRAATRWRTSARASSRSAWASGSGSPPRCSATRTR